jgi:hypothetical protein
VQIQVEAIVNCGAVDLRDETTRTRERRGIQSGLLADLFEFHRRAARMPAPATADVDAEFRLQWF